MSFQNHSEGDRGLHSSGRAEATTHQATTVPNAMPQKGATRTTNALMTSPLPVQYGAVRLGVSTKTNRAVPSASAMA